VSVTWGSTMPATMRLSPAQRWSVCAMPRRPRAKLIADRHGVQACTDLDDLLKQVDIVSVAAPTSAHFSATKACLEAGKHVLVEKPIAVTSAEARELVELAARRGCLLQVGHSERFNPIMQRMRPFIERPAFIECHRLSAFGERGTDVDVVLDLMIHDLDLVLSFNPGRSKRCGRPACRCSRRTSISPMPVLPLPAAVSRT
jgi:predicted dehydrogenase